MATVNKDFKIKSGLVVEGLQGTINGEVILTENAGDQYILDLIGGETLVKSVSNQFDVSAGGELSLDRTVVDAYYDAAGSADDAETAANSYTDGRETAITTAYEAYADQAEVDAKAYTDTRETAITTAYQGYADTAEADAKSYADSLAPNYDPAGSASTAQSNAEDYADAKISDANGTATDKAWSAYKTSTEIGLAQAAAEQHADDAVAALVDGAPALLDTLNELAAALADNPNYATDVANLVAGKQNNLTEGANIDITDDVISVVGLDSADISDFNTAAVAATAAAYDMYGAAAAAQSAAEDYADGLAINYDAAGSALTAQTNAESFATNAINDLDTDDIEEGATNQYFLDSRAKTSAADLLTGANLTNITITGSGAGLTITAENGVADSTTTDLAEGTNKYFTDARARDAVDGTDRSFTSVELNSVAKQIAATLSAPTAGIQVAHAFAKADYRSAEYLVKVAYGTHTEISKVLLTLDSSDNIAITEYGIVGTNGSASSISAGISGANVQLQVTTANNDSTVTVMGTLLV
jgi:hypothetical protein